MDAEPRTPPLRRSAWVEPASTSPEVVAALRRYAAMTPAEVESYERELLERVADLALFPPRINTDPLPDYDSDQLDYGMTAGIERTPGGRIWAAWIGGEDGPRAFLVAATSDDGGETWSKPRLVVDSQSPRLPLPRSVIIANFWTDPDGRLWLFFDQTMNHYDGRQGVWASVCDNPDADAPVWSEPVRLWHGAVLNKPIVRACGEWLLPLELPRLRPHGGMLHAHDDLASLRGSHVLVSTDRGRSWSRRGCVVFPDPSWDENMLIELRDGRIWMLGRTRSGVMESFSSDGGHTWTVPVAATFAHPSARFFVRRLASGMVLLIKHGAAIDRHDGRKTLTAWLSDDDGRSWRGGLILDEREGISYPDGFQAPDSIIHISYDRNRATDGEILMARFTEDDILARAPNSSQARLKTLISRPLKKAGIR